MQRAVSRIIRGSCRKWRDNDKPVIAGEEVRKKQEQKQNFAPPKHTLGEAIGWTAGLVVFNELDQKRRQYFAANTFIDKQSCFQPCPFRLTKNALSQPQLSTLHVQPKKTEVLKKRTTFKKTSSIDRSPLLPETLIWDSDKLDESDSGFGDDDIVFSDDGHITFDVLNENKPLSPHLAERVEKFAGDIFSALGSVKALRGTRSVVPDDPPVSAMELLNRGANLGSCRALYNIGVMYDRKNDSKLAEEYYKRAADLGHPLASYNYAVFTIRDGRVDEGRRLMQYAADNGVPEAKDVLKDFPAISSSL